VLGRCDGEWGVGQLSAGVDQCFVFAINNQELVGLHALAGYEGIEHQALVVSVVEENNRCCRHFGLPQNSRCSATGMPDGRILQTVRERTELINMNYCLRSII